MVFAFFSSLLLRVTMLLLNKVNIILDALLDNLLSHRASYTVATIAATTVWVSFDDDDDDNNIYLLIESSPGKYSPQTSSVCHHCYVKYLIMCSEQWMYRETDIQESQK